MPFQGTRSKCRKILKDLAEFRTIGARKRIRTRSNELEAWLDKDRACAEKRVNITYLSSLSFRNIQMEDQVQNCSVRNYSLVILYDSNV